jgi:cystathionine beta-lyase/cystathionine gamma-synthase
MSGSGNYGFGTDLAHFGEDVKHQGAVIPPIYQNSLFVFDTMEELLHNMHNNPGGPPHHYSRVSNPTLDLLETKLAHFEGGEKCKVFAAGMTAVTVAIMSAVEQGSHVVAVDGIYGPAKVLLTQYLAKFGVECTIVDGRDTQQIIDACKDNTTLIYLESPTSLTFRLQDIGEIAKFARSKGITTMIDSTYNTPIHMRPLDFGIDVVIHSLTKYYGGHSNATGGAVIGSSEFIDNLIVKEVMMMGALLGPFQSWLFTQGSRTLKVRLKEHEATANRLAAWLEQQPEVKVVHHIGLDSFAQKDVFQKTMTGSSGLFAFEANTKDKAKIMDFCNRLKLFGRGISWGGFESLVVASHVKPMDYAEPEWFIRLFCGLEDVDDLLTDVANALPALR